MRGITIIIAAMLSIWAVASPPSHRIELLPTAPLPAVNVP